MLHPLRWAGLACAVLLLVGCSSEVESTTPARGERPHLVEIEPARVVTSGQRSTHTGHIEARRRVRLHSQEEGRILELPWYEGDRVEAGQVLVRLDDSVLRARHDQAVASRRQAESDLARIGNLAERRLVSEDELARARTQLELAQAEERVLSARLGHMILHAPFTGIISRRLVEPGDAATGHTHLLTLVDPDSLAIAIAVSELLLSRVRVGAPVSVRIDALGGAPFPGVVQRIHPEIDARTGRGTVEVALQPVPEGARPGQFARVELETAERERLLIPFAALQRDTASEYVYGVDGEGRAVRRPVRSGDRVGDRVEIVEGLAPDEAVIVRGMLGLRPGRAVTVVAGDAG